MILFGVAVHPLWLGNMQSSFFLFFFSFKESLSLFFSIKSFPLLLFAFGPEAFWMLTVDKTIMASPSFSFLFSLFLCSFLHILPNLFCLLPLFSLLGFPEYSSWHISGSYLEEERSGLCLLYPSRISKLMLLVPFSLSLSKWPCKCWPHFVQFLFPLVCLSELLLYIHSSLFFYLLQPYFHYVGRGIVSNEKCWKEVYFAQDHTT